MPPHKFPRFLAPDEKRTRTRHSQLKKSVSPMVALVICAGWKTAEVFVVVLPPTVMTICFADAAENTESCSQLKRHA